jgi:hypothetical protein
LNCEFIGCFLQVDEFFLHPRADAYPWFNVMKLSY